MIRYVYRGSRIPDLDFFPSRIPDPGVKKSKDPQHCPEPIVSLDYYLPLFQILRLLELSPKNTKYQYWPIKRPVNLLF